MLCLLTGSVGMGYFIYGKKQRKVVPLASGVLLCIFPYFVSNVYLFIGAAAVLFILPFVIKTQ